jgi:hypothetical protein
MNLNRFENDCQLELANDSGPMIRDMFVVTRWRVPDDLAAQLPHALADLAELFLGLGATTCVVGRNLDEPELLAMVSTWADVGSYRRALSSYDVKLALGPIMSLIVDEPSAYESAAAGEGNVVRPRSLD